MPESWIALSTCSLTQPCTGELVRLLSGFGNSLRIYQADGDGGRALEADALRGQVSAVVDVSLAELAAELTGSAGGAGPDRLTSAALRGVPQIIALGALDAVRASREAEPTQNRRTGEYAGVCYARTTPEENDRLGQEIAHKASAARGPTTILVPHRGLSALDATGEPFWWPEADEALAKSLENWLSPHVRFREVDLHINDAAFAAAVADHLSQIRR